jgi:hypothetical protein
VKQRVAKLEPSARNPTAALTIPARDHPSLPSTAADKIFTAAEDDLRTKDNTRAKVQHLEYKYEAVV